jgi:acetylornithine deacetylase/succinyl-diaminopimelate desuccinylase-like protein
VHRAKRDAQILLTEFRHGTKQVAKMKICCKTTMTLFGILVFGVVALPTLHAETKPAVMTKPPMIDDQAIRRAAVAVFPEYFELLSMPSDSINPADIQKNAAWLVKAFERRGFHAQELDNAGKPLVFASFDGNTGNRPTILFYIHFDGQPVIPTQWSQKDPWSPVVKERSDGGVWAEVDRDKLFRVDFDPELRVFARAAADDKGPIAMFLACFDALRTASQQPAIDVKVILDSEEEVSSPGIPRVVEANKALLKADALVVLDAATHASGRPTILFGNRGVTPLTLVVYGSKVPAHSGHYGNYAPNPAQRMARLLAGMKDDDGRVTIPGYYDRVTISDADRKILAEVPEDEAALNRRLGIAAADKVGSSYQEAIQFPSLNVRGLAAAEIGDKVAGIIPNKAVAELDLRTTVEADGDYLYGLVRHYVESQGYVLVDHDPTDAERAAHPRLAQLKRGHGEDAARQNIDSAVGRWATSALARASGQAPVLVRQMGATVPTAELVQPLGLPFILVPTVNADDNQHTYDENLRMGNFLSGMKSMLGLLQTPF